MSVSKQGDIICLHCVVQVLENIPNMITSHFTDLFFRFFFQRQLPCMYWHVLGSAMTSYQTDSDRFGYAFEAN